MMRKLALLYDPIFVDRSGEYSVGRTKVVHYVEAVLVR